MLRKETESFTTASAPREYFRMKKTKIVIAGGGFAGLYAAKYFDKHLARRPDIEVTLIARENFILFTPMLHEVAAGDLAPGDIVNPLRRILRHVNVIEADVQDVDLSARKVRVVHGFEDAELEFEFDHLLLALGSETNFFDNAGIRDWAVTMKNLRTRRCCEIAWWRFWKKRRWRKMQRRAVNGSRLLSRAADLPAPKRPARSTISCVRQ